VPFSASEGSADFFLGDNLQPQPLDCFGRATGGVSELQSSFSLSTNSERVTILSITFVFSVRLTLDPVAEGTEELEAEVAMETE